MATACAETISPRPPIPELPKSWFLRGWNYFLQMASFISFFAIGLVVSPFCALLVTLSGDSIPAKFGQILIRQLFRTWTQVSTSIGVFDISFPEAKELSQVRGVILAANHPTVMDAVILLGTVPRSVCIMRASLINNPCLGGAARLARFVANDRGPALIRQGVEKILNRENLLIFPEGTRTVTDGVNPFKQGFALVATKSGAPIHTVFIERDGRYLGKGISFFAASPLPIRYRLQLGKVFHPHPDESAHELTTRMEEYFLDHLHNTGRTIQLKKPVP